jgi:hypothetical protein
VDQDALIDVQGVLMGDQHVLMTVRDGDEG